jgi:prepilin peptidase CpaA
MSGEFIRIVLLCALAALLVAAAITDIRSRIISNRLNLAIALLAPLYWLASGIPAWPDMALQVGLGIACSAFRRPLCIGTDGRRRREAARRDRPVVPVAGAGLLLLLMAVIGGAVTLVTVIHHRMSKRLGQPRFLWRRDLARGDVAGW